MVNPDKLTDSELIKVLLSDEDTEDLIRYWMSKLIDWLNTHPVYLYENKSPKPLKSARKKLKIPG